MISVLHVVNGFRTGGVETQLLRILGGYDRNRFRMDVCIIGGELGDLADEALRYGTTIVSCPKSPNLLSFSRRFARLAEGKGYDVVHSHFEAWSGAILRGASMAAAPVRIAHLHGMRPWPSEEGDPLAVRAGRRLVSKWGRYWICRHATHVLAVSRAVAERRRLGCPPDRVGFALWTGGVDTDKFSPDPRGNETGCRPATVIWVGALRPVKRIDLMLLVFRSVLEAVPEARLLLVGGGKQESDLRKMAQTMGLAASVEFFGLRRDVPELLRSATAFLSCSEAEGMPTAILEAQAAGLPVVASDIAPHREALPTESHGFLFGHGAPERGAEAVVAILKDPDLRANLANSGRRFVQERYSAAVQLEVLQDYYTGWVAAVKRRK